jgi:hypothetical protein
MKKSQIYVIPNLLDKIADSDVLWYEEKLSFLQHIWYLKESEQKELINMI